MTVMCGEWYGGGMSTNELATIPTTTLEASSPNHFNEVAGGWLTFYRNENTREAYRRDLWDFATWCADVHGITPLVAPEELVNLYADHLAGEGLALSTQARHLAALSSFYKYATRKHAVNVNPAAYVVRPRTSNESPTLGMDKAQAAAFLNAAEAAGPRDYALACLLTLNGLRISEALSLNVGATYAEHAHQVIEVLGKGDKKRRVPIGRRTLHAITAATGERTDGPLLTDSEGARLNRHQARRIVARLARAAGIANPERITPHSCRHTFVTLSLEAGVPLHKVQDGAGHASPETTRRYDRQLNALKGAATYALTDYLDE